MRVSRLVLAIAILGVAPLHAQGITGEFHGELNGVQKKIIDLAAAMPETSYDWRPGPGVRSVREVYMHVIADNYYIAALLGKPAPAATGIGADYATANAYEKKALTKAQIGAELTASFSVLHQAFGLTTEANASQKIKFFGGDVTRSAAEMGTIGDLHEHLGQSIAYARMNKVVPPWSK